MNRLARKGKGADRRSTLLRAGTTHSEGSGDGHNGWVGLDGRITPGLDPGAGQDEKIVRGKPDSYVCACALAHAGVAEAVARIVADIRMHDPPPQQTLADQP